MQTKLETTPAPRSRPSGSRWLRGLLVVLGVGACGVSLPACNTTEGVGEDIRALGDAIDDAAEDAND